MRSGKRFSTLSVLRLAALSPGFQFVSVYRLVQASKQIPVLGRILWPVLWVIKCNVFRCEISIDAQISGGLYIPHPYSIVVGRSVIGSNVTILQNVTVGVTSPKDKRSPYIGDGVFIGAGACVLGGVRIGRGAVVGANSVVLSDVGDGVVVVGAPARSLGS